MGEYKIKNADLAERMAEIRQLAKPFRIQIQHVLRHLNKEPDALANKAMDLKQSVGFNPIENLHPAVSNPAPQPQDNTVNGVAVEVVERDAKGTAKKKKPAQTQPSLFDGF